MRKRSILILAALLLLVLGVGAALYLGSREPSSGSLDTDLGDITVIAPTGVPATTAAAPEAGRAEGRQALLENVRWQPCPKPGATRHRPRCAGHTAPLGPRAEGVRRVSTELLRRGALREHGARRHLGCRGGYRQGPVAPPAPRREALDACDRRLQRDRQLEGRHGHRPRQADGAQRVATAHGREGRVVGGRGGRRRLLRRHGWTPVRRRRRLGAHPLGVRHGRAASTRARPSQATGSASRRTPALSSACAERTDSASGARS